MLKPTNEHVILVDQNDHEIGVSEKHAAHQGAPQRHRAFSVFTFNTQGQTLIQKRALSKYHSAGLWANTCCGHPRPGENIVEAATRRTFEEFGFTPPQLTPLTEVCYTLNLGHGLWELEYTHVYRCIYEERVCPNPEEICDYRWVFPEQLKMELQSNPGPYARWFRLYVLKHFDDIFIPQAVRRTSHGKA